MTKTTMVSIRMPLDLHQRMKKYKEQEGTDVTFQLIKGAELYLKGKKL